MSGSGEQRRGNRAGIRYDVGFRKPREMAYEVPILELSQHGCRIELREKVKLGQLIWIALPGLEPLQSWVRWTDEWIAGLEFERPMHVSVYEHVASRLKAA